MSEQVNDEGRAVALSSYAGPLDKASDATVPYGRRRYQLTGVGIGLDGFVMGVTVAQLRELHADIGAELYRLDVGR